MQALQTSLVRQNHQHWHRSHGGAARVSNNTLGRVLRRVWLYLRDHERNIRILAVRRTVIHHGSASGSEYRSPLLGGRTTRGEQCHINICDGFFRDLSEVFYDNLVAAELQLSTSRAW